MIGLRKLPDGTLIGEWQHLFVCIQKLITASKRSCSKVSASSGDGSQHCTAAQQQKRSSQS